MQGPGLSEGDLAFYRENGYLMIEDAVSPEDLAELQAVARDFIDRSRRVAESNDIYDLELDSSSMSIEDVCERIEARLAEGPGTAFAQLRKRHPRPF